MFIKKAIEIVLFEGKIYHRATEHIDARTRNYFRFGANKFLHVALWESHHGRKVPKGSVVHHEDDNPLNSGVDNLKLLTRAEHTRHHKVEEWKSRGLYERTCVGCEKVFLSRSSQITTGKYCTMVCRKKAYVKTISCKRCGKPRVVRKDSPQVYCGYVCLNRAKHE